MRVQSALSTCVVCPEPALCLQQSAQYQVGKWFSSLKEDGHRAANTNKDFPVKVMCGENFEKQSKNKNKKNKQAPALPSLALQRFGLVHTEIEVLGRQPHGNSRQLNEELYPQVTCSCAVTDRTWAVGVGASYKKILPFPHILTRTSCIWNVLWLGANMAPTSLG